MVPFEDGCLTDSENASKFGIFIFRSFSASTFQVECSCNLPENYHSTARVNQYMRKQKRLGM